MATIDLGKIKLVWRGTYSGGTAYTVDDVVQHTDGGITSSFICTTDSTGNAPSTGGSVHGSWAYLAKGAAGSVLTTQGDILYRDGSGDQRLAKGTAGQFLKMNSSANAPEWGAVSGGDYVKLASGTFSSSADNLAIDGFTDSAYKTYVIRGMCTSTGNSGNVMRMRLRDGSTDLTAEYLRLGEYRSINTSNSSGGSFSGSSSYNQDHWIIGHHGSTSQDGTMFEITLSDMTSTTHYKNMFSRAIGRDGSQWVYWVVAGMYRPNTTAVTGLKLYTASGNNFTNGDYQVYGIK